MIDHDRQNRLFILSPIDIKQPHPNLRPEITALPTFILCTFGVGVACALHLPHPSSLISHP
jgi:hypothetical protein